MEADFMYFPHHTAFSFENQVPQPEKPRDILLS